LTKYQERFSFVVVVDINGKYAYFLPLFLVKALLHKESRGNRKSYNCAGWGIL